MVQFLLSRGADIFAQSDAEMTAFSIAAKEGHIGILEILQHEAMQRKEAAKAQLPLPVLETSSRPIEELSQRSLDRLSPVTDKIEFNEVKGIPLMTLLIIRSSREVIPYVS